MNSYNYIFSKLLLEFPESENRLIESNNNFEDINNLDGRQNIDFLKIASIILAVKMQQYKNKKLVLISTRANINSFVSEFISVFLYFFKIVVKKQKNKIIFNENEIEFLDINNYILKQDEEIEELIFFNCIVKNKLKYENDLEIISKGLSKIKKVNKINIK